MYMEYMYIYIYIDEGWGTPEAAFPWIWHPAPELLWLAKGAGGLTQSKSPWYPMGGIVLQQIEGRDWRQSGLDGVPALFQDHRWRWSGVVGSRATWPDVLCYRKPRGKNTSGAARSARFSVKETGGFFRCTFVKGMCLFDAQEFRESWWSFFSLGFLQNF